MWIFFFHNSLSIIWNVSEQLESRVPIVEIKSEIEENMELNVDYYVFLIISTIITTTGLIVNSTAVVIGAMIISPLMTPILGVSYGLITRN